jgi:hypothetical protein
MSLEANLKYRRTKMAMNTVLMLENSDGTSGLDQKLGHTDGWAHIMSPANAFGTVTSNEVNGTGAAANTAFNYANGLNGVTVSNGPTTAAAYTAAQDAYVYVAFNNTSINDPATAGLRYCIPPNSSMTLAFTATPLPTTMTLRVTNATCKASFVAVEN